ncbi:MAG TPA: hypothetical protein QF353_02040 [Gammaproteobacteria bacterium]|nr:hypothetical protein [Gammaproteobacteria bacterium]
MVNNTDLLISVNLFGVLRDYSSQQNVIISTPINTKVEQIREILINMLLDNPFGEDVSLFKCSVIADETEVLSENALLTVDQTLYILPPVCGG